MQIRHRKKRSVPGLNMAAMPDLIFTVLFFFMIVTHMRTEEVKVKYEVPSGTEVSVNKNKFTTINIYIGKDKSGDVRIQVNDRFVTTNLISKAIAECRTRMKLHDGETITVNMRVDKSVSMGVVSDVKRALRNSGIQSIRYSASESKDV